MLGSPSQLLSIVVCVWVPCPFPTAPLSYLRDIRTDNYRATSHHSLAGDRHWLDTDRHYFHLELLFVCGSLRRDLQTTTKPFGDVDLGAALLVSVGSTLTAGVLVNETLSP